MADPTDPAPSGEPRTVTTPGEAFAITALVFGWFILAALQAVNDGYQAEAFTTGDFIGLVITEAILAIAAVLLLRKRGFAVASLLPRPTWRDAIAGVLLFLAGSVAGWLVEWPFLQAGAPDPLQRMMAGAADIPLATAVLVGIVNGSYEEVFLLGFLVRGLRGYGLPAALGVSLLVRALCHLYQGPIGIASVLAFGLVLSLYFVARGRLFPVVFAHALADIAPFL